MRHYVEADLALSLNILILKRLIPVSHPLCSYAAHALPTTRQLNPTATLS
jgi:hypothetical protein